MNSLNTLRRRAPLKMSPESRQREASDAHRRAISCIVMLLQEIHDTCSFTQGRPVHSLANARAYQHWAEGNVDYGLEVLEVSP